MKALNMGAAARKRRKYSADEKHAAIQTFQSEGIECAVKKHGVCDSSVFRWTRKFKKGGIEALVDQSKKPKSHPKQTSKWVVDKILSKKKECPEMGSQGMSSHLKRAESVDLSGNTIAKIFKKHGLADGDVGYAEASFRTKGDSGKRLEKQVEKEIGDWERFARENPNDMLQMDIMDFYIRDCHRVYLISALDDCSRMIVGWGLFRKKSADNVLEVLRTTLARHGAPKEILTDQGSQFKHWGGVTQFEKLLSKLNIRHTKARSHHPQTCGKIEAFHKTIQRELIDKEFFVSQEQATEKIARYIEHYNYARPHSALDGYTPSDRYFGVINAVKKYLADTKAPANAQAEREEGFGIARASKIYLVGKVLGNDVRIRELGGQFSIHVNGRLFQEVNLVSAGS